MESLFLDLTGVLEQQRETFKEMLAAARDHNNALRLNDVAALKEVTVREEGIAAQLKSVDQRREQLQSALEVALGLPAKTSLSGLLPHVPQIHGLKLSLLANEMRDIIGEIAGLVEINGILTRRAIQFNEQLLRLLKPKHNDTYRPNGKSASPANLSSLINKTV